MNKSFANYYIKYNQEKPSIEANYKTSQSMFVILPPLVMIIIFALPWLIDGFAFADYSILFILIFLVYTPLVLFFHEIIYFSNGPQSSIFFDKSKGMLLLQRKSPFFNIALLSQKIKYKEISAFTIVDENIYGYRSNRPYRVANVYLHKRFKLKKIIWRSNLDAIELKVFLEKNTSKIVNYHDNRIWDDVWVKHYGENYIES